VRVRDLDSGGLSMKSSVAADYEKRHGGAVHAPYWQTIMEYQIVGPFYSAGSS
jgi:hypothetical protein